MFYTLISGIVAFWIRFWSLWSFRSRLLVPDRILDQTSGLTLVPVTFSQFPGLLQIESFSFNLSSDNFVQIILFIILASFGSTSLEHASSRSYSAAMDPKMSLSTVFSDFSLSLLGSLPWGNSESIKRSTDPLSVALAPCGTFRAGLWSSSESLVGKQSCERLDGLPVFEITSQWQWLWYVSKALNHALGDRGFNAFNEVALHHECCLWRAELRSFFPLRSRKFSLLF